MYFYITSLIDVYMPVEFPDTLRLRFVRVERVTLDLISRGLIKNSIFSLIDLWQPAKIIYDVINLYGYFNLKTKVQTIYLIINFI